MNGWVGGCGSGGLGVVLLLLLPSICCNGCSLHCCPVSAGYLSLWLLPLLLPVSCSMPLGMFCFAVAIYVLTCVVGCSASTGDLLLQLDLQLFE